MPRCLLAAIVLSILTACSSVATIEPGTPIANDLTGYRSIHVAVTSTAGGDEEQLAWIEADLGRRLGDAARFGATTTQRAAADAPHDLRLAIDAVKLPEGGIWDRGLFAHSIVELDVSLIEARSGRTIGACAVTGEGKGGALWTSAGGRALDRAIEKIVEWLGPAPSGTDPAGPTPAGSMPAVGPGAGPGD